MIEYLTNNLLKPAALYGAVFLAAMSACISSAIADSAYYTTTVSVPHRKVPIRLDVYYPVEKGGNPVRHGNNAVFGGITISDSSVPATGRHPVVFFSHGSGGNGINTGWFLKAIAEARMIAIAPNHPGSTSRDSHPDQSLKTWQRPQDISALIDMLPDILPEGLEHDESRIAATGFSMGGHSALALAGAQLSKTAFIDYCRQNTSKGLDECGWFTSTGYDLEEIDRDGFEKSSFDPRISAIVSIDPGFAPALTSQSLERVSPAVMIINLGSAEVVPPGVEAEAVAASIPGSQFLRIENSWHFSFLGECKALGSFLLWATFDDPICRDVKGKQRSQVHREIAAGTIAFLQRQFSDAR